MTSKTIRQMRAQDAVSRLMEGGSAVFLTLTTPIVVSLPEIREMWRSLRHWLLEDVVHGAKYVMNYELHPKGHGWHIHAVFSKPIDLRRYLRRIQSYGFGRVDVRKVNTKDVSDYLTKHCLKAYRGLVAKEIRNNPDLKRIRLVNASRGLPRLDDYEVKSELTDSVKALYSRARVSSPALSKMLFCDLWKLSYLAVLSRDPSIGQIYRIYNDPVAALGHCYRKIENHVQCIAEARQQTFTF